MTQHTPPSQPGQPGDATPPAGFGVPPGAGATPGPAAGQPGGQGFGVAPSFGQPPAPGDAQQPVPGQPPAFGTPPPPPPGGAKAAGGQKSGKVVKTVVSVVAAIAVVAGIRFGIGALLSPDAPEVGDCLSGESNPNDRKVVDCSSDEAVWSVIGTDGTWTYANFQAAPVEQLCTAHAGWQEALWWGDTTDSDADGELFCLAPAN